MHQWFLSAAEKKRSVAKDNLLQGKIQAARPQNTNRMQSDVNVVLVKSEISLRETTIDGCVQRRRRKRRMELQLEKGFCERAAATGRCLPETEGRVPVTEVWWVGRWVDSEVRRPR